MIENSTCIILNRDFLAGGKEEKHTWNTFRSYEDETSSLHRADRYIDNEIIKLWL